MTFRFLDLPPELRNNIYSLVFDPRAFKHELPENYSHYRFDLNLFRVCRQLYHESRRILLQNFAFVVVDTPWEEAQEHVSLDGHVPIIAGYNKVANFQD